MGLHEILALVFFLFPGESRISPIPPEQQPLQLPFLQAALLRSQGEYEESFAALQRALTLARGDQRHGYQAKCLLRMGLLKWDLGDIAESERYFGEAAAAFLMAKDPRSHEFCAKCLELIRFYNLGKEDRKASLFYRSIERFEAACLLGREIGIPGPSAQMPAPAVVDLPENAQDRIVCREQPKKPGYFGADQSQDRAGPVPQ